MKNNKISKLFDNKKINKIDASIMGGLGSASAGIDTVNGIAYDQDTVTKSGGCDGTNTGLIGSTGEDDNPYHDFSTSSSSYTVIK